MADLYLGIDVGGTKSLLVTLDPASPVTPAMAGHRARRAATPRGAIEQRELVDHLAHLVVDEVAAAGRDGDRIVAVGIGMPGLVSREGVLRAAPNLDGVGDLDVAGGLAAVVDLPVLVDNDATCATLAEWRHGAGRGADDIVVVALGTGIGGGVIAGWELQHGAQGFAGELGHMIVDPLGWECPCGRRGCWERYASGSALPALARAHPDLAHSALAAALATGLTGEQMQDAARAGDRVAIDVFATFARCVAVGLSNLTNLLDPDRIVIAGGVSSSADLFLAAVRDAVGGLVYQPERRRLPDIVPAEFGEHAGAVGAALLCVVA